MDEKVRTNAQIAALKAICKKLPGVEWPAKAQLSILMQELKNPIKELETIINESFFLKYFGSVEGVSPFNIKELLQSHLDDAMKKAKRTAPWQVKSHLLTSGILRVVATRPGGAGCITIRLNPDGKPVDNDYPPKLRKVFKS